MNTLIESNVPGATLYRRGKVRDVYEAGGDRLVIVASDRLSAFDVVLPTPIPDKGRVLTELSSFWFDRTERLVPNHLISTNIDEMPPVFREVPELEFAHANRLPVRRRGRCRPALLFDAHP